MSKILSLEKFLIKEETMQHDADEKDVEQLEGSLEGYRKIMPVNKAQSPGTGSLSSRAGHSRI
jgi:hypothetical protein